MVMSSCSQKISKRKRSYLLHALSTSTAIEVFIFVYICQSMTLPPSAKKVNEKLSVYSYATEMDLEGGNFVVSFPWPRLQEIVKSIRRWGHGHSARLW